MRHPGLARFSHWPAERAWNTRPHRYPLAGGVLANSRRPSRPITLTLPVATIEALAAVDADLSRAIVRLVQTGVRRRHAAAELATFGRRAVIVVNASKALERRIGIDLVPLPDGRALISFEDATTPDVVELRIEDALEDPGLSPADRAEFDAILEILKTARRSGDVAVLRRNIIVLEGRRRLRSGGPAPRAPRSPHHQSTRKEYQVNSLKTLGVAGAATLVMLAAAAERRKPPPPPSPAAPTVQAPALEAPAADTQLDTLRPDPDGAQRLVRPDRRAHLRVPDLRQQRVHQRERVERAGVRVERQRDRRAGRQAA